MSGNWLSLLCLSSCLMAMCSFAQAADEGHSALTRQIQETITNVRTGRTLDARTDAADELSNLTRNVDPKEIDDETLAKMVSLLDSPEDPVRAYVAGALGFLGPRAKSAIPKLVSILPLSDCIEFGLTSAGAIRVAITRMGGTAPPAPNCPN